MRVRLRLERLQELVAASDLSQNHWAIRLGLSRGHWSDLVNGKHPYPSPRTRERMLEAFGVALEELFEVETTSSGHAGAELQSALGERYVIDRELAQGGMGAVYLGRDVKHGRVVAIKVVAPEAVGGIGVTRFLREIAYVSRLQHPNILPLFDSGDAEGAPYYVMPYIRGGSLRDRLRETARLSLEEVVWIVRGVAAALAYAHGHQVLHCDVKPENVLLDGEHPYVMDFGIARVVHAEMAGWGRRSEPDTSAGTPAYVSPEQAGGDGEIDGRSDLYSLACMTFEMLAGRAPFRGRTTLEVVAQRFKTGAPELHAYAPELPRAVVAEVERAMAVSRADRHSTVTDFAAALERAARGSSRVLSAAGLAASRAIGAVRARAGLDPSHRLGGFMGSIWNDARYAVRALAKRPGFAVTAILTLGLGIGASTSMFSILDGSILKPLPYPAPDRLYLIRGRYVPTGGGGDMSVPNFLDLQAEVRTFSAFEAFSAGAANLATEDAPARVRTLVVSAGFFDAIDVRPALGRPFAEGEDREGAAPTAIITDRLWRTHFDRRPDVVGRTLELDGVPHTVIGVLPPDFWFQGEPDVVVPFAWTPHDLTETRGNRHIEIVGRLAPGVSESQALGELKRLFADIAATYPDENNADWTMNMTAAQDWMLGFSGSSLWLLSGAVLLVLVIGCVNVANLLLVRAERRQREMAVRAAIGAGRGHLIRSLLAESLALAGAGSVVGVGLAWLFTRGLLHLFGGSLPRAEDVGLDLRVIAFAAGLAVVTGLAVGLVPALRLDPERLSGVLREGGHGTTRGGGRLRGVLVVVEVALAVMLVSGAGLLLNSFWRLNQIETGIDARNAFTFRLQVPTTSYPSDTAVAEFYERAVAAIAAVPGVRHVGITNRTPLLGGTNITSLASPVDPTIEAKFVEIRWVTPDFFQAAGIRLLRGRELTAQDGIDSANAVVISERLARTLFPDGDAVGRRIDPHFNEGGFVVVGVVGSVREWGATNDMRPCIYWAFGPGTLASRSEVFMVRTTGEAPLAVLPAVRRTLAELDPTLPLYGVATMERVVHATFGTRSFATTLFAAFGVLALALAALGIFSVLAFTVEQRTREVGIRMALGATSRHVTGLIVTGGLKLTGVGLVLGIATAAYASRILSGLLYDVKPADPITLGTVAIVALVAAVAASYLPARRAATIEPMHVVREE